MVAGQHFRNLPDPLVLREDGQLETRALDRLDDLLEDAVYVLLPLTCAVASG